MTIIVCLCKHARHPVMFRAVFGSYAQTIIQNPVYFNPPILKLDKMVFQWFDVVGNQITNAECEWNAAIQIVEEIPTPSLRGRNPVIIPPQ